MGDPAVATTHSAEDPTASTLLGPNQQFADSFPALWRHNHAYDDPSPRVEEEQQLLSKTEPRWSRRFPNSDLGRVVEEPDSVRSDSQHLRSLSIASSSSRSTGPPHSRNHSMTYSRNGSFCSSGSPTAATSRADSLVHRGSLP